MVACAYAGAVWSADATAPVAGTRPAVTSLSGNAAPAVSAAAATDATAQGNVAELTQLLHDARIVEMRTTYNGSYGASLMFDPREMTYYVALFQDKHLWRVIKSQEKSRAEMVYANFVQQTAQLADVEIRRTELQAQKTFLERVIALQANRAQQLQADLSVARSQQAEVAQRQKSAQEQTQALQVEKRAAQMQLRDLQEQVRQLERQTETGLPARK
ncbi:putative lipoprotein [Burkholderia cepacia GG4]|uniref:Lipoprotein n=2 Tax=Burkholderia cepacia TaxID=292 RepID=A0A9W3K0W8_BURCE|nr:putative lipoprotein [Burkholderia cepacia GG4]